MVDASALFVTLSFASVLVGGICVVFCWRHRETPGAPALGVVLGSAAAWSLFDVLRSTATDPVLIDLWSKAVFIAIAILPVGYLVFAVRFTGFWHLSRTRILLMSIVPVGTIGVTLTNSVHNLMWADATGLQANGESLLATTGPWFAVHTLYSYGLLAVGTILLARSFVLSNRFYRVQAAVLLVGCLVPWVGNVLYITGSIDPPTDPVPAMLTVTGLLNATAVFRHDLLDVVPAARDIARDVVIESMAEGAIVLDARGWVVDANQAAVTALDRTVPAMIGKQLEAVNPDIADAVSRARNATEQQATVSLSSSKGVHHYDIRVSPIERGYGSITGSLVGLQNVTERRKREQRLEVQNRLLRHNLRNEMNVVQGNASLITGLTDDSEIATRSETISRKAEAVVERGRKLKHLDDVDKGAADIVCLSTVFDDLIASVSERFPNARLTVTHTEYSPTDVTPALTVALEELLVNAIEHSHRDEPIVDISIVDGSKAGEDADSPGEYVTVRFSDNGPGIPSHEIEPILTGEEKPLQHATGIGLWVVVWIVREAGGDVAFDVTESGTTVTVSLPRAASAVERDASSVSEQVETASPKRAQNRQQSGGTQPTG